MDFQWTNAQKELYGEAVEFGKDALAISKGEAGSSLISTEFVGGST